MKLQESEKINIAYSLFEEKKYLDSFRLFESLARDGNDGCQLFVGWMYFSGLGVEKNYSLAEEYFLRAHQNKNIRASFYLGLLYLEKKQFDSAIRWLKESASLENPLAMYRLGVLFDRSKYIENNEKVAIEWLEKASSLGHLVARAEYSIKLLKGKQGFTKIFKGLILFVNTIFVASKEYSEDPDSEMLQK